MWRRWGCLLWKGRCSWSVLRSVSNVSPREQIQAVLAEGQRQRENPIPRFDKYLEEMARAAGDHTTFTPLDVCRVLHVCSKMERESEAVLRHALQQIRSPLIKKASVKDLSMYLYCLSVFHKKKWLVMAQELRDEAMEAIFNELQIHDEHIAKCNPIDLTQMVYALAIMDVKDNHGLWMRCRTRILDLVKTFPGRQCATVLWSLVKWDVADKFLMEQISRQAVKQWKSMKGREKSMTMWSWGCLGDDFSNYVCDAMILSFKDKTKRVNFRPQHYSNFLLTLARIKPKGQEQVVENLVEKLLETMKSEEFGDQSLSNTVWALGQLKYQNQGHVRTLMLAVVRPSVLGRFTPQGVCNVAMGCAMLGVSDTEMIELLAEETVAPTRLPSFHNQELAMLNWALGKMKLRKPSLIEPLVQATIQTHKLQQFDERQLCAILHGWACMGLDDEDSIQKVLREALSVHRISKYKAFEVANLVWAIGSIGVKNETYYELLCKELTAKLRIVSLRDSDVKTALIGFERGKYGRTCVGYFFRDVFDHWLPSGKLHSARLSELKIIHETLPKLPYMEPALIHQLGLELRKRESSEIGV